MKKIYYSIFLFIICTLYGTSQMQNQETIFMANIWHLQKLEINQNIIPAPNNTELSLPQLLPNKQNNEYYFLKEHCSPGVGQAFFKFNGASSLFIDNYVVSSWLCKNSSNESFMTQLYDNDFIWDNVNSNFQYVITDNITYLELIIMGQNGNKAYYHNNLSASVSKFELKEKIKLYPNPVSDTFFISGDDKIFSELKEIVLYDFSGKLVFQEKITENSSYNISHLVSGSYIVYFKSDKQLLHYDLIIKK